jgi:hypothetical protein
MGSSLEEIFSEGHLRSYAHACIGLAADMPGEFDSRGLDTLVIPSRGAVPIFVGMVYALNRLKETFGKEYEEFYNGLGVQEMIYPLLSRVNDDVSTDVSKSKYRVLLIPFTADLNMERFDPNLDGDDYVKKTRNFWARVTGAFFKDSGERVNDPYFRAFTDIVLREIETRPGVARDYEEFPRINRFGIMDTVISGRASTQIITSFDEMFKEMDFMDSPYYAFLIIDENGRKLKAPFKQALNRKALERSLKQYPVARIVSEDEGAALLGVASVVYPSLMRESERNLVLRNSGKEFFVGAGSWRLGSELGKEGPAYSGFFDRFRGLICSAIDYSFSSDYGDDPSKVEANVVIFRQAREDFLDHLKSESVLMKSHGDLDPSLLGISRSYTPQGSYETGSRVAHVPFTPESTARIMEKLCRKIQQVTCREPDKAMSIK